MQKERPTKSREFQNWKGQQILSNPLKGTLSMIIPNSRVVLPKESENGLTYVCQSSYESANAL